MELKKYQFIGMAPLSLDENSELEQSDDDSEDEGMNNRKFKEMIREQMKQIFNKDNSIDVALLNMRSWKHSYDATHMTYLSVILPAILNEVVSKIDAKTSKKQAFD